jgi:hypothetical protein
MESASLPDEDSSEEEEEESDEVISSLSMDSVSLRTFVGNPSAASGCVVREPCYTEKRKRRERRDEKRREEK